MNYHLNKRFFAMKTIRFFFCFMLILPFLGCTSDDGSNETAVFAVPIVKSLDAIRSGISVTGARETHSDGKIYVSQNYLFYIAQEEGIHVFDNQNPASPQNIAFIALEGVHDIAVKGNHLYADNYVDLVTFDISSIQNITVINTLQNVFSFYPVFPDEAEFYDYTVMPNANEIIVGYNLETKKRPTGMHLDFANDAFEGAQGAGGIVGVGGSYARFQINNNALYVIEPFHLNVINISNPLQPVYVSPIYMTEWFGGGQFETLFKQKDYLFVGATNGMFVFNATDEFNPYYVSGFSHATACDPVVVNQTTAYITVRGGTTCGAIEDQINVIDISNISNPTLVSTYLIAEPYGLGYRSNTLYVCCKNGGLKVFDATNGSALSLENTYTDVVTDVITLDSHLIAVGMNKIIQYNYGPNFTLTPISTVNF